MIEWNALADVEQFRHLTERRAVQRAVEHATLVLGSTQNEAVCRPSALEAGPTELVRRRGGGGAVLLLPGDHLWIDAWIPHDDPLWHPDVARAAFWVGAWWQAALAATGVSDCDVHRGRAIPGRHDTVCFSGRGPGEVFHRGAKVMGLSQWRSREGALFHACAYTHWEAEPLVSLLELDDGTRATWRSDLAGSAVGLDDLPGPGHSMAALAEALLSSFPGWGGAGSSPGV